MIGRSSRSGLLTCLVVMACAMPMDLPASDAAGTTTDSGGTLAIVDFAAVATPGNTLWARFNAPVADLFVTLDGRALDLVAQVGTDTPRTTGLYVVPREFDLGTARLAAQRLGDPRDEDSRTLEIVSPLFVDVAAAAGLDQVHDVTDSPSQCAESHTGLAFGDFDGDGDPDAYVGHVGNDGRLYQNRGDQTGDGIPDFVEITSAVGLTGIDQVAMATFIDWDGDGDRDLFVGRRGANRLMANRLVEDGKAVFVDVTPQVGLGLDEQRTMGVAFGDFDQDGDLDLYVVNHAICFPAQGADMKARDHLYRNDGGVFVEITDVLGGGRAEVLDAMGFSAVWIDIERDGDQDLLVINDDVGGSIGAPNAAWRNDGPSGDSGGWVFTDVSASTKFAVTGGVNGMGIAVGDVDQDGFADVAFSNIGDNYLLFGSSSGSFRDGSLASGIGRGLLPWGTESITWATHLFDYDNDGDLDLYFAGGRIKGTAMVADALFRNEGNGLFTDQTWPGGLDDPGHGKASALVDLDRDGFIEFATARWGSELRVYRNTVSSLSSNHWLVIELVGTTSNREALGAIVELETTDGRLQTCFRTSNPALGAGGEPHCHFGLGTNREVRSLRIIWPDGSTSEPPPPGIDRRVTYVQ